MGEMNAVLEVHVSGPPATYLDISVCAPEQGAMRLLNELWKQAISWPRLKSSKLT